MADDARIGTRLETRQVIALWPEGPPTKGPDVAEIAYQQPAIDGSPITILRNVSQPTITVFRPAPDKANGVGVIVAPGGGWRILAWDHEGVDVAEWLAERGYTAFLLKYRVAPTPPDPPNTPRAWPRSAPRWPSRGPRPRRRGTSRTSSPTSRRSSDASCRWKTGGGR